MPEWAYWVAGVGIWLVLVVIFAKTVKPDDNDYWPMD